MRGRFLSCCQACARICKCLGGDFKPYLPFVIPPLLDSAQIDPELHVTDADEDDGAGEEEGMESVTVAIRGQGNKRITIRTSALEEKATACSMLRGSMLKALLPLFALPQPGSCSNASSGHAWWPRAARHSRGGPRPVGSPPRPPLLERAASKVARFTGLDR